MSLYVTIKAKHKTINIDQSPVLWCIGTSYSRELISHVYLPENNNDDPDPEYGWYQGLSKEQLSEIVDYFNDQLLELQHNLSDWNDDIKLRKDIMKHTPSIENYNDANEQYLSNLDTIKELKQEIENVNTIIKELSYVCSFCANQDDPKAWELVYSVG